MTPDAPPAHRRLGPAVCAARHGTAAPRGLDPVAAARGGRFVRMFPGLPACAPSEETIAALVAGMTESPDENPYIPSGYTYLAQFVDHDITFDPQSSLERANDPHALVNFRTPRFDLDSLYGSGPADQPFLYDWSCASDPGVKLLVGQNLGAGEARVDLPRNEQGRALLGDARNDENRIISQLHLLFIHFHNKVVTRVRHDQPAIEPNEVFQEAQCIVRWHYQWVVVHDLLARIVGKVAYEGLRPRADGTAAVARRWLSAWHDAPMIPVEFSGAAYRFGHSMVRAGYRAKTADDTAFPLFRSEGDDRLSFAGFSPLPGELVIEWDAFFFKTQWDPDYVETLANTRRNFSFRLDTNLSAPLFHLPPDDAKLAQLNLRRGRALGLPSGHDVALAMEIEPMRAEQLTGLRGVSEAAVAQLKSVIDALPLWAYVLLEAKVLGGDGTRLGPVGGGIVSEVLLGLLEADPSSYLHRRPAWRPELADAQSRRFDDGTRDFTMLDLVRYVEDPDWL
jgi:hypothetical protein